MRQKYQNRQLATTKILTLYILLVLFVLCFVFFIFEFDNKLQFVDNLLVIDKLSILSIFTRDFQFQQLVLFNFIVVFSIKVSSYYCCQRRNAIE